MSKFVPNKVFLRGVLLHYFHMNTSAAEAHRILVDVYGKHALAEQTCRKWFARFKAGELDLDDKKRPGQPKKFEDDDLEVEEDEENIVTKIKIEEEDLDYKNVEEHSGQSSFDLASNKPDILQLVSESDAFLKEEVQCKEEDINDTEKVWMDVQQEVQLANILDKTEGWKKLVQHFNFDDFIRKTIEQSSISPSMLLLNYIGIQTNTSLSELRNILEIVGEREAAAFMAFKKMLSYV